MADIADLFARFERQSFAELPEGARSTFAENWAATRESLSDSLFRHVAAERGKALVDEANKGVAQSVADAARAYTNPEALNLAIASAENGLRLAGRFLPEGSLEQHIAQARSGIVSAVLEKHIAADPTGAFPRLARLEAMLTETDRAGLREKLAAAQRGHQEAFELARLFETPPEDRDAIERRAATIADPSLRDSVAAKAYLRFAAGQAAATAQARQRDRDRQEAYADLIGRAASGRLETGEIDGIMADPRWRPDELRRMADAFGRHDAPQPDPAFRPDRKEDESDSDWARRVGGQLRLQSDPPILTGEIVDWSHARLNAGDADQQIETARLIRGLGPDMTRNLPQAELTYALKLAAYADAGIDPDKATALARSETSETPETAEADAILTGSESLDSFAPLLAAAAAPTAALAAPHLARILPQLERALRGGFQLQSILSESEQEKPAEAPPIAGEMTQPSRAATPAVTTPAQPPVDPEEPDKPEGWAQAPLKKIGKDGERYARRNDGEYVQLEDGGVDFGLVKPDLADQAGLPSAPIRLERGWHDKASGRGMGDLHLEAQHGAQIRSIIDKDGNPLFKDPAEFVQFVARNHNEIRQSKNGGILLIARDKAPEVRSQNSLIVELRSHPNEDFYTVITAGRLKNKYLNGSTLLTQ